MQKLQRFIESKITQTIIITLIVVNAIILGLETSSNIMAQYGNIILKADSIILAVFIAEILIRVTVYKAKFFKDPWSLFDFSVVVIALIPASGPFAIVRALRVLRVLRLLTMIPSMQRVVGALLSAIPGLGSIALVLIIFYYVTAVMATHFFGQTYPQWFGNIGQTLYTLFQIMTLESWSMGIVRPVMQTHPFAWMFFIPFILIATFTMLNLFIAIIVNAMQNFEALKNENKTHDNKHNKQNCTACDANQAELKNEITKLSIEIQEIKRLLKQKAS